MVSRFALYACVAARNLRVAICHLPRLRGTPPCVVVAGIAWGGALLFSSMVSVLAAEEIFVVGSSTVSPFTVRTIEGFSWRSDTRVIVEATGTTGGMRAFCASVDISSPSITGASRPIKEAERERCRANGVTDILEILIGRDGAAIISSPEMKKANFTRKAIYRGLAAEVPVAGALRPNPYRNWKDIDLDLPAHPIVFFGPPNTSGTREFLEALGMFQGAVKTEEFRQLPAAEKRRASAAVRLDGPYREMGEDDAEIVNKVRENVGAFGIVGFAYAHDHEDEVRLHKVDGVDISVESIRSGEYPLSRYLFLYVKEWHLSLVPGLAKFLNVYVSDESLAPRGRLEDSGLVPLSETGRRATQDNVANSIARWANH